MSLYAKILSLSYDSAAATKSTALKTYYRSVRLIKEEGTVNPGKSSYDTNILLCGNCVDPETRNLYVFFIDNYYLAAWIIEINIDTRVQTVVYYDKDNNIGFDPLHKIYNAKVVHGRLVWTDKLNPIYQMDVARAKRSFALKIGYGQYPNTSEWVITRTYSIDEIVSDGNNFYKSLISNNIGVEPRFDSGVIWQRLCLIEDAYYSMNVKNFYFEPAPPTMPPEVTYQADDSRKINNLRQTLFQFAYRYVYMDWRKSTFSPASTVPAPQAEEETATGLANEQISLNNKLQIIVNSGGEEVRAVEIIGRSSRDPSAWYLIETINKFDSQERGNEISKTVETDYTPAGLSVLSPTILSVSPVSGVLNTMGISVSSPSVLNTWVAASLTYTGWTAEQSGNVEGSAKESVITTSYQMAQIGTIPSWITVLYNGQPLVAGMSVNNGSTVVIYPKTPNTSTSQRAGSITFTNLKGDSVVISFIQAGIVTPVPITPNIQIDPEDTSGMTLGSHSGVGLTWSADVSIYFIVDHPTYATGATFDVYWRALVNGLPAGNGRMASCTDTTANNKTITLNNPLIPGDSLVIYLKADAYIQSHDNNALVNSLIVNTPVITNSAVSSSLAITGWTAAEYGVESAHTATITSTPTTVQLTTLPSWLAILNSSSQSVVEGMSINDGEVISIFPKVENTGGAKSGYIVFTNSRGDTVSITVLQAAALVPPPNEPVDCQVTLEPYSSGLTSVTVNYTQARSNVTSVMMNISVLAPGHATGDSITVHWRATINGVAKGYGDFSVRNNVFEIRSIILDSAPLVGDEIIVYLSHV